MCPGGQRVAVTPGRKSGRYLAYFEQAPCQACPLLSQCPTRRLRPEPATSSVESAQPEGLRRRRLRVLRVTTRQAQVAQLRQRSAQVWGPGRNLRAAVESTVRSVKHPFGGQAGKLPVRGQGRVALLIITSALMVNLRRIWRYRRDLMQKESQQRSTSLPTHWRQHLQTLIYRWYAHLFPAGARALATT